jgi:hypothetical protein
MHLEEGLVVRRRCPRCGRRGLRRAPRLQGWAWLLQAIRLFPARAVNSGVSASASANLDVWTRGHTGGPGGGGADAPPWPLPVAGVRANAQRPLAPGGLPCSKAWPVVQSPAL